MTSTPLNVLLIGGGAREHALALGIAKSPSLGTLYATHTTNPGIAKLAHPVDTNVSTGALYRLEQFCDSNDIHLVVIGPEDPLAQGWADALSVNKKTNAPRLVFGPGASGAKLEADKAYAKQIMRASSIPTGDSKAFKDPDAAIDYLRTRDEPYVVKATGLAKGKGVVVPNSMDEAERAIIDMLVNKSFGDAGSEILLEEKLTGTEVSVLALTDGSSVYILPPCQDHKRLLDNDEGPNTGGMGAFCPAPTLTPELTDQIERDIMVPLLDTLRRDEIEFRGVIYAGLMLTHGGPKVLEFNVRFGDPECQPLTALIESDLLDLLTSTADGRLEDADIRFSDKHAVCVVLASEGYPQSPKTGVLITGLDDAESLDNVVVTHAGTARENGQTVTNGGRVLSVTGLGDTHEQARAIAYEACDLIAFEGMQRRNDIGASVAANT